MARKLVSIPNLMRGVPEETKPKERNLTSLMLGEQTQPTDEQAMLNQLARKVQVPKRTWEDFYLDLVAAGEFTGAMKGISQITKPEAVKQLSKSFKRILQPEKDDLFTILKPTPEQASAFRQFTKGIRKAPQEVLEPIRDIRLNPKLAPQGKYGKYLQLFSDVELALETGASKIKDKATETLFHEIGHSMQHGAGVLNRESQELIEAHAYDFGSRMADMLKGNKKINYLDMMSEFERSFDTVQADITNKTINQIATQNYQKRLTNQQLGDVVKELGGDVTEFFMKGKQTSKDIVKQAMETKSLTKDAFELGREIHAGNVSPAMVKEAHTELMKRVADPMERATRGQFMNEALEFADILAGKTAGKEGKVEFLKKLGMLPKEFKPSAQEFHALNPEAVSSAFGENIGKKYAKTQEFSNLPKDFVRTTERIADRMIDYATEGGKRELGKVLEPHGGEGHLAQAIYNKTGIMPDILELNPERVKRMQKAGLPAKLGDFLTHKGKYDTIIMNPPFSGGQAKIHLLQALDLLKEEGKVVSLLPGREVLQGSPFRNWLESQNYMDLIGESKMSNPTAGKPISISIVGGRK